MELSEHDGANRYVPFTISEWTPIDHPDRMGPTFGGMMSSGVKAAKETIRILDSHKVVKGKVVA